MGVRALTYNSDTHRVFPPSLNSHTSASAARLPLRTVANADQRLRGVVMVSEQILHEIAGGQGERLTRLAKRIPSHRNGKPTTLACVQGKPHQTPPELFAGH